VNPRIKKIKDEIEKIKVRMNKSQIRLRELENQLTNLENADIVAAVRSVDIAPDELSAFVQMFKEKQQGVAIPDLSIVNDTPIKSFSDTHPDNDKEGSLNEN
jgi:hypothetical protein